MNPCVAASCWSAERGENISWDNPSGGSMSLGLRSAPEFSRRLEWGWEAVNNPFMYPHPHHHEKQCDAEAEAEAEGSQAASFRKYNESMMGLSSHQEKTFGMLGGIRSFGGFPSSSGFHGGLLYTDMPGFGVCGYESGSPWLGITTQHGHKEGTVFPDIVKREGRCAEELQAARIGLNLGHRTYFSEADAAATVSGLYKRPRAMGAASSKTPPRCQAEGCKADLSNAKHYHRRHKVCEFHSKASSVVTCGVQQRFCQQCSRFHGLSEFDETKRSCRKRLADHNRRRRKPPQPNAVVPAPPLDAETPTPTPTPALLKAFNNKS